MNPYPVYLVFGIVYDPNGVAVPSAKLEIKTSVSTINKTTNSDGIFMYDLADAGYVSGETVKVIVTEPLNNELKAHTFVVNGFFNDENITLSLRTSVQNVVNYPSLSILHSVGKSPITADNPLPMLNKGNLLDGYELSGIDDDNLIYGYIDKDGRWYIQKTDVGLVKYVKGSSAFESSWNDRTNLIYQFFNEVFG